MTFFKLALHGLNITMTKHLIQNQSAQKIAVPEASVFQNVLMQIFRWAIKVELENIVG